MYKLFKTIGSLYRGYNTVTGAAVLAAGVAVVGGLAGLGLPLYAGWEIGDYVKNALELGPEIGTATKVIGAVGLTAVVGGITVPAGIIGGMIIGGTVGAATGKAKASLEKLISGG